MAQLFEGGDLEGNEKEQVVKTINVENKGKRIALGAATVAAFAGVCALLTTGGSKVSVVLAVLLCISLFTAFCVENDTVETLKDLGEQMKASPIKTGDVNLAAVLRLRKALRFWIGSVLFLLVMLVLFGCGELMPTWSAQWMLGCALVAMLAVKIDAARAGVHCKFVPAAEGGAEMISVRLEEKDGE